MSGMMGQQLEEDKTHISLKVKNQEGAEIIFVTPKNTEFKKLMRSYCDTLHVEFNTIKFVFSGRRILEHNTPEELEMKDGDVFDAMKDGDVFDTVIDQIGA